MLPNIKHYDNGRVHVYERITFKEKTSMFEVREETERDTQRVE